MHITDPENGAVHTYEPGDPVPSGATGFVRDVFMSLQYLSKSSTAQRMIRELCEDPKRVSIVWTADPHGSAYEGSTHVVAYCSIAGHGTKNGYQTPALGLLHELGHAHLQSRTPIKALVLGMIAWPQYSDLNERYVIRRFETPAADELGETGTRTGHNGTPYLTQGPTTTCAMYDPQWTPDQVQHKENDPLVDALLWASRKTTAMIRRLVL